MIQHKDKPGLGLQWDKWGTCLRYGIYGSMKNLNDRDKPYVKPIF